jgi:hypothetical protein
VLCDRVSVLVTWVGVAVSIHGNRHAHIYACGVCVDRIGSQQQAADASRVTPLSRPCPGELWVHLAATALSCFAVVCAAAALWLAGAR